ncbi:MAG: hypothetical protein EBZ49_00365 [Proteobacteria bacterium]|nr:hypothetical protein [Pseudomonadota bacterium]
MDEQAKVIPFPTKEGLLSPELRKRFEQSISDKTEKPQEVVAILEKEACTAIIAWERRVAKELAERLVKLFV